MAEFSVQLRERGQCALWMSLVLLVTVWSPKFLFNTALTVFAKKLRLADLHNSMGLCEFQQFELLFLEPCLNSYLVLL